MAGICGANDGLTPGVFVDPDFAPDGGCRRTKEKSLDNCQSRASMPDPVHALTLSLSLTLSLFIFSTPYFSPHHIEGRLALSLSLSLCYSLSLSLTLSFILSLSLSPSLSLSFCVPGKIEGEGVCSSEEG